MTTRNSLLARIKQIEETLSPEVIHFPKEKTLIVKNGSFWQVAKLNFTIEKEALGFSKRLKKDGLHAYLDEIKKRLDEEGE